MVNLQVCFATSCLTVGWLLVVEGFGMHRTGPDTEVKKTGSGLGKPTEETKSSSPNEMEKHLFTDISSCEQYISHGHCQFYACMDDLLRCPGAKHEKILVHKFCNRAKHHADLFTTEGIAWARNTNKCVIKSLVATYNHLSQKDTWCSHLDTLAKDAFVECAATEGVCAALGTERTALAKVFTAGSWMTLVEAARDCPPAEVNQFIFWNLDHMHFNL